LWAVIAWCFGIPTSESHALISGILGAAVAFGTEITQNALKSLALAALGLVVSLPIGGIGAWIVGKIVYNVSLNFKSNKREVILKNGQKIGAAAMSFMHGAQDSQKFAGVFVAAMCMADVSDMEKTVPVWLVLLCATIMSVGTSVGGYRIIKKVGMETVALTSESGLAADIAAALCMLLASFGGIPVSTTHTATSAVIGAGLSCNRNKINFNSVKEMLLAWILTFPCCGIISYLFVKLFLYFFN
jgi:PiT family inorganic phosphate transporter